MKLSRRDRAEMTLALECLRSAGPIGRRDHLNAESVLREAWDALALRRYPGSVAWAVAPDLVFCAYGRGPSRYRILRARLALALRVLLRADAGDFGRPSCKRCLGSVHGTEWGGFGCYGCGSAYWNRALITGPTRPLWEQAPAHEAPR